MNPGWSRTSPHDAWLHESGSNRRPLPYEGNALPTAPPCIDFWGDRPGSNRRRMIHSHVCFPYTTITIVILWWERPESNRNLPNSEQPGPAQLVRMPHRIPPGIRPEVGRSPARQWGLGAPPPEDERLRRGTGGNRKCLRALSAAKAAEPPRGLEPRSREYETRASPTMLRGPWVKFDWHGREDSNPRTRVRSPEPWSAGRRPCSSFRWQGRKDSNLSRELIPHLEVTLASASGLEPEMLGSAQEQLRDSRAAASRPAASLVC